MHIHFFCALHKYQKEKLRKRKIDAYHQGLLGNDEVDAEFIRDAKEAKERQEKNDQQADRDHSRTHAATKGRKLPWAELKDSTFFIDDVTNRGQIRIQ